MGKNINILLLQALIRGDARAMHILIQSGADVGELHTLVGEDNISFLHHAAHVGNPACMEVLLSHGANVHAKTKDLRTPLHGAENPECVEILLKHGAKVDARDIAGCTPLHRSIERKHSKCVKVLLENGADPNVLNDSGFSPLDLAIHHEDLASIELLIPKADVNKRDENNYTPLHTAASRGYVKGLRKLLQVGADVNAAGHIPCTDHDEDGNPCGKFIIRKGERVIYEKTDFCLVCEERAKFKTDKGHERGVRPLHLAVYENDESCTKVLIAHGADVNVTDENGVSPLHIAVTNNYITLVKLLIDAGANVNAINNNGETPLMISAKNDLVACMQVLLNAGTKLEIMTNYTALGCAAMEGHDKCVELLLKHGAKTNTKQKKGETILFLAAERAHFTCVKKLLLNGALL